MCINKHKRICELFVNENGDTSGRDFQHNEDKIEKN